MFVLTVGVLEDMILMRNSNDLKRLRQEVDALEDRERRTGLFIHLLPQENRNIDGISDVFVKCKKT